MALNWSWNYGPENMWETEFQFRLGIAQDKGDDALDRFFKKMLEHARRGRYILKNLRFAGVGTCEGNLGDFIDLFTQGMSLAVDITSEVKFFEVKMDELVADVPCIAALKVRYLRELVEDLDEEESEGESDRSSNSD